MSDLPIGAWSQLLVGHQWPSVGALSLLAESAQNRANSASLQGAYAEAQRAVLATMLQTQAGATADSIQEQFEYAAQLANALADRSESKNVGYVAALQDTKALRDSLTAIAEQGNHEISAILSSAMSAPEKISRVTECVASAQMQANARAASHGAHLLATIQSILANDDPSLTAQKFAESNGVELSRAFGSPNLDSLGSQVGEILKDQPSTADRSVFSGGEFAHSSSGAAAKPPSYGSDRSVHSQPVLVDEAPFMRADAAAGQISTTTARPSAESAVDSSDPLGFVGGQSVMPVAREREALGPRLHSPTRDVPGTTYQQALGETRALFGGRADTHTASTVDQLLTSTPTPPHTPHFSLNDLVSPNDLAEGFSAGNQTGAPISAGAEALSAAATAPVHSQLPAHVPALENPATPIFENAHAAPPPATAAPAAPPPSDTAPPVITAAPAIAPIQQIPAVAPAIAATPAPASGLLAYGADIKPTAAPVPPPTIAAGAPAPAPNSTTAGAHTGQPSLVRQQPLTAAHPPPTAGLAEKAIAATAAGSAAGAGAAHSAATHRLRRLLDTITRQEPQLRWAIGDLDDGTTRLVTDLAGGWVPPGISIPTGVRLRHPANRRGGLRALLGPTVLSLTYNPGRQLEETRDSHPVPTSVRARDVTPISDLGWELSRATKWRDGLPRLAHTLARAAAAETGCLATEVEALHACIKEVADEVKTAYPKAVDATRVGDWQLLATILALVNGERTLANYHFAWFQTHAMTTAGNHDR